MGKGSNAAAVPGYANAVQPSYGKAGGYDIGAPTETKAEKSSDIINAPVVREASKTVTFESQVVELDGSKVEETKVEEPLPAGESRGGQQCATKAAISKGFVARTFPCAVPLRGVVQHYAWGKLREASLVAAMATEQVRSKRSPLRVTPLSRGTRFAELWMGTHPNGPSSVVVPGASMENSQLMKPCFAPSGDLSDEEGEREEWFLKDLITQNPYYWLGDDWQVGDIPYLFKVLSVHQALSIQAHPNKTLAEKLHKRLPSAYPDGNHKPEICIPLGHFEALCGFRRTEQIRTYVREVKELGDLCIENEDDLESEGIKELYSRLMTSNPKKVCAKVDELLGRISEKDERTPEEDLIMRVSRDYPGDVGIFSIFFLNYVRITADMTHRFIYCAPDEPHAYLMGECVECMALSDNVVRAGLTPKFKDVETLLEMMTYRDDLLDELVGVAEEVSPNVVKYDPPVNDFLVYEICGPVEGGLRLSKASIAAQVLGSSRVTFVSFDEGEDDSLKADSAPQTMVKGYTFFSKAGTTLYVDYMEEGAKLFIATY